VTIDRGGGVGSHGEVRDERINFSNKKLVKKILHTDDLKVNNE